MNEPTDIIDRMEANQARFGQKQLMHRTAFPSLLQSAEDERRRERNRDLEYESLMADEIEYGQVRNLPNDEGWRQ